MKIIDNKLHGILDYITVAHSPRSRLSWGLKEFPPI
jgi:hypothetical protein